MRTFAAGIAVAGVFAASGFASAEAASAVSAADRKAITATIRLAELPSDADESCAKAFTSAFRKKLFGTTAQCVVVLTQSSIDGAEDVKLSAISVSGKTAKVTVKEIGGTSAGAVGTWTLVKSGKTWKVSGVDVKFFRSAYSRSLGKQYKSEGAGVDPLHPKAYRACGLKKLLDRSDTKFLTVVYQLNSSPNVEVGKAFSACTSRAPGGKSPFFEVTRNQLNELSKNSGFTDEQAACIVDKVRAAYKEAALINVVFDGQGTPSYDKFGARVQSYVKACTES